MRLKIHKKLRTASLNSEFTGSYKKSVVSLHPKCFNIENSQFQNWRNKMLYCSCNNEIYAKF